MRLNDRPRPCATESGTILILIILNKNTETSISNKSVRDPPAGSVGSCNPRSADGELPAGIVIQRHRRPFDHTSNCDFHVALMLKARRSAAVSRVLWLALWLAGVTSQTFRPIPSVEEIPYSVGLPACMACLFLDAELTDFCCLVGPCKVL